jgi:transcriptional regulator with GAF, ATPase, and Fis domain
VIAATNGDLAQAVKAGRFREDLYYRLNVFPLRTPPLRERGDDIELLAVELAGKFARKIGRTVAALSPEALGRLRAYDWPGNVRELENVIERAVITSRNGVLNLDFLAPQAAPPAVDGGPPSRVLTAWELQELERDNILRALESTAWRISGPHGAAQLLGLPPSTLSSRMDALGIRRRSAKSR